MTSAWEWWRRRIALLIVGALVVLFLPIWWFGNDVLRVLEPPTPSISHGTSSQGWLEHGKRMPTSGPGFSTYSRLGSLFGRTAVHSTVRDIMLASYARIDSLHPGVTLLYGESGSPEGGPFWPHRTHQDGTAIDLFVPVLDGAGHRTQLPIAPWNEFGYWIEFDRKGDWHGYTIDFPLLAEHLLAIQEIAVAHGARMRRVILAPEFADQLARSEPGRRALAQIPWMKTTPWVRHDEHYHIDFTVPGSSGVR